MNALKTGFLMMAIFALFLLVGSAWGQQGMIIAFVFALAMNGFSYWFSDKIILMMYRAHEVTPDQAPRLYAIAERLSQRAKLPMPKVYIIDNESPNAFATGRNPKHAAIAATTGILRILDDDELAAVIAHELGHVQNRDILISTIVATVAGAIMLIANIMKWSLFFVGGDRDRRGGNPLAMLAIVILAPLAAVVIQMAISRAREFMADESGAHISGDPLALANALRKLQAASRRVPLQAGPATSHLFIVKPLSAEGLMSIFSTHPRIEDRIARLEKMAR